MKRITHGKLGILLAGVGIFGMGIAITSTIYTALDKKIAGVERVYPEKETYTPEFWKGRIVVADGDGGSE
jgi:hypothetical protein